VDKEVDREHIQAQLTGPRVGHGGGESAKGCGRQ
jgi:hypothetical protein